MNETVLVTRFCRPKEDGTLRSAYNNFFSWPRSGPVSCPDWDPKPCCGNGLHGWLWGQGHGSAWTHRPNDVMLVVEVQKEDIVDLDGKVKFPKGNVIFAGTREEVTRFMSERGHVGLLYGAAVVGSNSTAQAGDYGTAQAGGHGTAQAGDGGKAEAGDYGTATAGDYGTATAGYEGTAQAGYNGKAEAGHGGTAQAGYGGKAEAGHNGTAKAGDGGTAIAGKYGKAQAGKNGEIHIRWYDGQRYRTAVGYTGTQEGELKPDTWYEVDDKGNFVEVSEGQP